MTITGKTGKLWRLSVLFFALLGVVWIVQALLDESNTGAGLFFTIVSVLVFVFPVAYWLYCININVRVAAGHLAVGIWPFSKTNIPLTSIQLVTSEHVDGLKDYWGWGVRGTSKDLFYGFDDGQAVKVVYTDKNSRTCTLKVLVDDPDNLIQALESTSKSAKS